VKHDEESKLLVLKRAGKVMQKDQYVIGITAPDVVETIRLSTSFAFGRTRLIAKIRAIPKTIDNSVRAVRNLQPRRYSKAISVICHSVDIFRIATSFKDVPCCPLANCDLSKLLTDLIGIVLALQAV
jgi:hypothetical protein